MSHDDVRHFPPEACFAKAVEVHNLRTELICDVREDRVGVQQVRCPRILPLKCEIGFYQRNEPINIFSDIKGQFPSPKIQRFTPEQSTSRSGITSCVKSTKLRRLK
jgi:hypothetical protein